MKKIKYIGDHRQFLVSAGFAGEISKNDIIDIDDNSYLELVTRNDFCAIDEKTTETNIELQNKSQKTKE